MIDKKKKAQRIIVHEENRRTNLEKIEAQGEDYLGFKNTFMLFLQV